MNDSELQKLIELLTALRNHLNEIYKDTYRVDITLGGSASGDYLNIHADITIPKQKRS
jgi:hypothetical protein